MKKENWTDEFPSLTHLRDFPDLKLSWQPQIKLGKKTETSQRSSTEKLLKYAENETYNLSKNEEVTSRSLRELFQRSSENLIFL